MAMQAIFVTGVPCSGKTTYCEQLAAELADTCGARPIILRVGHIMRGMFGERFFIDRGCKTANNAVENLVRSMIHHAIVISRDQRLPLLVDGAPRSVEQTQWIVHTFSNAISTSRADGEHVLEYRFLFTPEAVVESRLAERTKSTGEDDRQLTIGAIIDSAGKIAMSHIKAIELAKAWPFLRVTQIGE